ncbi:conserved domain protein [Paraprevotella xylaniphila YIT 11841]|uniref:Conserved domain protein n=1 Tax=Paraprevotella xylaniphila YIT 11841 TaxID=762982 RepID=F3QUN3_9BACT|nr:conserved domain protein [Paraprevotella xylaniphila YIT 11841]
MGNSILVFHLFPHSPCVIFAIVKMGFGSAWPNEKTSFSFVSALTFHYLCRSLIYHLEYTYFIR